MIRFHIDFASGGHATRSSVLREELLRRGFVESSREEAQLVIYDRPEVPSPVREDQFLFVLEGRSRHAHLIWDPFGPPGENVLSGRGYVILPPKLEEVLRDTPLYGEKKYRCTFYASVDGIQERLPHWLFAKPVRGLPPEAFWRRLLQSEMALLGWGMSFLEANYLGVPSVAVAFTDAHLKQAERAGCEIGRDVLPHTWFYGETKRNAVVRALSSPRVCLDLDLDGVVRTVDALEVWLNAFFNAGRVGSLIPVGDPCDIALRSNDV